MMRNILGNRPCLINVVVCDIVVSMRFDVVSIRFVVVASTNVSII
jgi:hypothetical protein